MSITHMQPQANLLGTLNVTQRKTPEQLGSNMAGSRKGPMDFGDKGSKFIDSILSKEESEDVISMMIKADENDGCLRLPSFCTSSQMHGRNLYLRPTPPPPLSPLYTSRITSDQAMITFKLHQIKTGLFLTTMLTPRAPHR